MVSKRWSWDRRAAIAKLLIVMSNFGKIREKFLLRISLENGDLQTNNDPSGYFHNPTISVIEALITPYYVGKKWSISLRCVGWYLISLTKQLQVQILYWTYGERAMYVPLTRDKA